MALTAAQIIARACQIAKTPGYTVQAGQYLNMELDTLCQTYDFDYIRKTKIINLNGSNGYDLNADHLRTREVFYSVNGTIFYLYQIPIEKYHSLFQGPGVSNYPQEFAIDVQTTPYKMFFWPPPSITNAVTVNYQPRIADITNPETSTQVPWFINQEYLIKKISASLMLETDDNRRKQFDADSDELLKNILTMTDDKGGYAQTIKLDRQKFKSGLNLRADKIYPFG